MDRRSERGKSRSAGLARVALLSATLGVCAALTACTDSRTPSPDPAALVRAEAILDRFYAWDAAGLAALVGDAEGASALLYYQGWAEAAHYRVLERRPCRGASATRVVCAVTVSDDFGQALGYTATDTFIFDVGTADVGYTRIDFEGDDPLVFTALFAWIAWDRAEILDEECAAMFETGTTPGECARAVAEAARTFADRFPLLVGGDAT